MVEHVTFNHGVLGSIPSALTNKIKYLGKPIADGLAVVAPFEPVLHQSINPERNAVCGR
jgi:hypothetical protein